MAHNCSNELHLYNAFQTPAEHSKEFSSGLLFAHKDHAHKPMGAAAIQGTSCNPIWRNVGYCLAQEQKKSRTTSSTYGAKVAPVQVALLFF